MIFIYKSFLLCKKLSFDLEQVELILKDKIENCKGVKELKNEKLIEFCEKEYSIIKNFNFSSNSIIPYAINLDTINDEFIGQWHNSLFFKYKFKKNMVYIIDDKHFRLFFKLFDCKDPKIFDEEFCLFLRKRFQYFIYSCPSSHYILEDYSINLIKNISLFIYIFGKNYNEIGKFLENTSEFKINSFQASMDIFTDLISNYKDISQKVKDYFIKYFIKNINNFNLVEKNMPVFFQILKSGCVNEYIIKEEELFNLEKNIESFIFLKKILDEQINIKYPELYETNYFKCIIDLSSKIMNIIKQGKIKFSFANYILKDNKAKILITDKFNILFLNNKKNVEICMKVLEEKYNKNINVLEYINILLIILKEFYEIKHQNEIKLITNMEKEIKEGMLNFVEIKECEIQKIYKIIPDLNKKCLLKESKFFNVFLDIEKAKNSSKNEDIIFNNAEESFKKLKNFFVKNWINIIEESAIKECFKAINFMER